MKKLIYILSIAAVASLTVLSCQKEQEVNPRTPSPAEVAGCYGVYFPTQEASGDHVYSPLDDPEIEITVARTNDSGAITVPVKITYSEDGIFVPQDIKFADGQKETTIKVRFDKAKEGVNYKASFTIEDNQYASLYNSNPVSIDFSVLRVEMKDFLNPKTQEPAVFTFTHIWSGSRGEGHATMKYYEVDGIRTCFFTSIDKIDGSPVGLWHGDPIANLSVRWYVGDQPSVYKPGTKASHTNSEGNDFVEIVTQYIGFDYNGGDWVATPNPASPINAYDWFWYWNARGYSIDELYGSWLDDANIEGNPGDGYPAGYYDGNGGFFFQIFYYIPGTGGWKPDSYSSYFIADGFTRVDYSFEVETDYPSNGKSPIYLEAGIDVAGIKYAIYEGELTATQVANKVAAITDGTDASVSFNEFELDEEEGVKYATLGVSPEATGVYTFVAVAYDNANAAQNSGSVTFQYVSAEDEEEYKVVLNVFTEDTPARYTSYHNYDSFAYGISGKDLTEVHVGIFTEATIAKYGSDVVLDAVKEDAEEYGATEEDLAAINGEGGYYTVLNNLDAKTTYYVIVWATNGSMDQFAVGKYTTEPMPYVWNSLGSGTLVDGALAPIFGEDPNVYACEVFEEANTPGFYNVSGYQCALATWFYEGTDMSQYPSYWTTDFYIHGEDPQKVYVEQQPFGIYSSSYGWIAVVSVEGKYGTFENNTFTFPAGSLNVILSGYNPIASLGDVVITIGEAEAAAPSAVQSNMPAMFKKSGVVKNFTFVRDPQPVKASVEANYTRKEKNTEKKVLVSNKGFEVR